MAKNLKLNFNSAQLEVIKDQSTNFFLSGGYRSGKSFVALYMITQIMRFQPNTKALIGRKHYKDLRGDTLEILLNPNNGMWIGLGEYNKSEQIFYFYNGSIAFFRHFDEANALKGPTTGIIFIEQAEEVKKDVWDVLKTRNSQWGNEDNPDSPYNEYVRRYKNVQDVIKRPKHYMFITSNPYPCWLYDTFIDDSSTDYKQGLTYKKYNLPTTVNVHNLPKGYLEEKQQEMSEQEYQQYVLGSWQFAEGRIYPEFNPDKHIVTPFEIAEMDDVKLIASIDTGFQHYTGVLFTALKTDGTLLIYDEIYEKEKTTEEIAGMIHLKTYQHKVAPTIYMLDYAANRVSAVSGKSEGDIFREKKIPVVSADKEVHAGLMRAKGLLKNNKIQVSSVCKNFIKEIGLYVWDPKHPDKPLKKSDDLMDPFRYIVNKCFKHRGVAIDDSIKMTSNQRLQGFLSDMIKNREPEKKDVNYGLL